MTDTRPPRRTPRFAENVAATLAGRVAAMAVSLVFATLLTARLGLARYGTWSFFAAFLGFSSVLDFGLTVAVERAVARAHASGDLPTIPRVIRIATALALGLAIAIAAVVALLSALLPASAWQALGDAAEAQDAARVLPIAFCCNLVAAIRAAGLTGLRRSAEAHAIRVAGTALAAAATLAVAWHGPELIADLLVIYGVAILATGSVLGWRVRHYAGPTPLDWTLNVGLARELAGIGAAVQASTLATQAGDLALRAILGARFGAASIGGYDLAARAAMALRSAASAIPVALVPHAQATAIAGGTADLSRLHARSVFLVALVVVAGGAALWPLVTPGLHVWLGALPDLADLATLVRILLVFHAVVAIAAVASAIARALGRPGPELIAAIAGNVAGSLAAAAASSRIAAVALFSAMVGASAIAQALWIARREALAWPGGVDVAKVAAAAGATGTAAWLISRLR